MNIKEKIFLIIYYTISVKMMIKVRIFDFSMWKEYIDFSLFLIFNKKIV